MLVRMAADQYRSLSGRPLAAPTFPKHLPTMNVGTPLLGNVIKLVVIASPKGAWRPERSEEVPLGCNLRCKILHSTKIVVIGALEIPTPVCALARNDMVS